MKTLQIGPKKTRFSLYVQLGTKKCFD